MTDENLGLTEKIKDIFLTNIYEKDTYTSKDLLTLLPELEKNSTPEKNINQICARLVERDFLTKIKGFNCNIYKLSDSQMTIIKQQQQFREESERLKSKELDFKEFMVKFLTETDNKYVSEGIVNESILRIDLQKIALEDFRAADFLYHDAEKALEIIKEVCKEYDSLSLSPGLLPRIIFENIEPSEKVALKFLKSQHIGKLISVDGIVGATTSIHPKAVLATYECKKCMEYYQIAFDVMEECKAPFNCGCGSRSFTEHSKVFVDFLRIRLQEPYEQVKDQCKTINCILFGNLDDEMIRNYLIAGNRIEIIGYMKLLHVKKQAFETPYLVVNNYKLKEGKWSEKEITEERRQELENFIRSNQGNVLSKVASFVCPDLVSMELEKKALILSLVGSPNIQRDGHVDRGNIHMLLIGDPSTGKSHLLQWAEKKLPKVLSATGGMTSVAGMTAAAVPDKEFGGYRLEVGTLVLANGGYVTLDEITNIEKEDADSLKESMENQRISINKAGIHAQLLSDTTILAGGNPTTGTFSGYESFEQQFSNFSKPLLSRFDIKIACTYGNIDQETEKARQILNRKNIPFNTTNIDTDLLLDILKYARTFNPEFTEECNQKVLAYFKSVKALEKNDMERQGPTIIPRTVSSLKRIATAIARLHLRDKVLVSDVEETINFYTKTLETLGFTMGGSILQFEGIVSSNEIARQILLSIAATNPNKEVPAEELMRKLMERKIDPEKTIQLLLSSSELFESRPGMYRVL